MIQRILLAVDDSAASMAATRTALEIAAATGAVVHALHVLVNSELAAALGADEGRRRNTGADALLAHVSRLAGAAGVPVRTECAAGEPGRRVLDRARALPADLVVLGRAGRCGPGQPYIGHNTQHVLEFAEWPVLTVPAAEDHRGA